MSIEILEKLQNGKWSTMQQLGVENIPIQLLRDRLVEARATSGGWKYRITDGGRESLKPPPEPVVVASPPAKKTRTRRPKAVPPPAAVPAAQEVVRLSAEPDQYGILVERHDRMVTVSRVRKATDREARKMGRSGEDFDLIDVYVLSFWDDQPPVVSSKRQFCNVIVEKE